MAPLQISSATAGSASHLRPILARPTKLGWVWSQPQSNNLLCLTNWPIFHSHGQTWVCWVFIATKLKVIFLKQAGQWPSWVEIWCRGAIICNLWPVIAQLGHFSPFWSNWVFFLPTILLHTMLQFQHHIYIDETWAICANQGQEMRAKLRQVFSAIWYRRKLCVRREGWVLHVLWTKQAWCWQ